MLREFDELINKKTIICIHKRIPLLFSERKGTEFFCIVNDYCKIFLHTRPGSLFPTSLTAAGGVAVSPALSAVVAAAGAGRCRPGRG